MAHTEFPVKESDILQSDTTRYLIIDFSGEGTFSKVAKCLNLTTNEMVAIKILKVNDKHSIKSEVQILETLMGLDPDKSNIVTFIESFKYLHLHCVVFEMLDRDLWELVDERNRKHKTLALNEIRPVMHQLMTAFEVLGRQGIMHTDLKSDNIMLVDHLHQPYKIKLIDFGQAFPEFKAERGIKIQPCAFRSPEVYLGAPLTTAVDMWGVGCVMAHLYFGELIFPYKCPYDWMRTVLNLLGEPDQQILSLGMYTGKYFKWYHDAENPGWITCLVTPAEYETNTGEKVHLSTQLLEDFENLDEAVLSRQKNTDFVEWRDRQEFLSLLKCCLMFNPSERITPSQALTHNFLTMAHLAGEVDSSGYAEMALRLMLVAVQSDLDKSCINNQDIEETEEGEINTPPAAGAGHSEDKNDIGGDTKGSLTEQDLTTRSSSDYSDNLEDLMSSTGHSSIPNYSREEESLQRGVAEPTSAFTSCMSAVDLNDRPAHAGPPLGGAADATNTGSAEDIWTGPNGAQNNPLLQRLLRGFLGTVRKRMRSNFQRAR